MNDLLEKIAATVSKSESLEDLVRPLLELLQKVTGLESTYLTRIDSAQGIQKIVYSLNSQELEIPENLEVPWADTLCKRALEEGRPYTSNVAECWGDSQAARALGIQTYLSEPVIIGKGELYGTLCGASGSKRDIADDALIILSMFAKLIARELEHWELLKRLKRENKTYKQLALADPLTSIPNRRALTQELPRALANAQRSGGVVHVAFIDLNKLKAINDQYGHDAGDRLLIRIAESLREGLRDGDFIGRYGGDEFVVFGPGGLGEPEAERSAMKARLEKLAEGAFEFGFRSHVYADASVGVVTSDGSNETAEQILVRADNAMYQSKKSHQA